MRSCVGLIAILMFGAICVAGHAQTSADPQGYESPRGSSEIPRTVRRGPSLYVINTANSLAEVDLATGELIVIGKIVLPRNDPVNDIAFAPDGTLYGISYNGLFFKIDPETGAASLVTHTISHLVAITFDSKGKAYVAPDNTNLYSLDPATGKLTPIGSTAPYYAEGDLVFYNDHLWLSGFTGTRTYLITLDLRTGAPVKAVPVGVTNLDGLASTGKSELYGFANTDLYRLFPARTADRAKRRFDFSTTGFGRFYGATYDGNFQP